MESEEPEEDIRPDEVPNPPSLEGSAPTGGEDAEVSTHQPVNQSTDKAPVGKLHRAMGVSVKTDEIVPEVKATTEEEAPPLTQGQLEECWKDLLEAMKDDLPKLAEQLKGRELRMEGEDMFAVVVNNSYLEAEIRPHLIRMLTYLRKKSRRPMLNCRVEVEYEEHEAVTYAPRDKYDVMVRTNPALKKMLELFPEVDY